MPRRTPKLDVRGISVCDLINETPIYAFIGIRLSFIITRVRNVF